MTGLSEIDLKQTQFYKDVFSEGKQEGRQEGRHEGRQEGRHEGETFLILCQLRRRLGKIEPAAKSRIRSLPVEQLEPLAEALLDFTSVEDLKKWLTTYSRDIKS